MTDNKNKIFTVDEVFDFCFANYCAETESKGSEYEFDWEDFMDEEKAERYDELDEVAQKKFDQAIKSVLSNMAVQFKALDSNITSAESLAQFNEKKEEIKKKLPDYMMDFIQ